MRTLIIGLGNPIVSDDAVGLHVLDRLRPLLADHSDVVLVEDYWGGLRLMEQMVGYDRAIVIDAIVTGADPGTIHYLSVGAIGTQRSASAHDVSLPTALAMGRQVGEKLPRDEDILLVGVEAEDILNFAEECTPAVRAAVPVAVRGVMEALDRLPAESCRSSQG